MAGNQAFLTALDTIKTSYNSGADAATLKARAVDPDGPGPMDVNAMLENLRLKFREAASIINYLVSGNMTGTGTDGIFKTGDATAASNFALLNDINTSLTS